MMVAVILVVVRRKAGKRVRSHSPSPRKKKLYSHFSHKKSQNSGVMLFTLDLSSHVKKALNPSTLPSHSNQHTTNLKFGVVRSIDRERLGFHSCEGGEAFASEQEVLNARAGAGQRFEILHH
ncbi:hypothetical protein Syun_009510 [Stephania yunnanensis]|uniref:Uncharacterized protein n=1 Tax=Stephania yunnanensis TaxID=152371 RepID=A0AAP0KEM2_9MAGN